MSSPDAQQVARRLLVLNGLVGYAHAMPPLHVWSDFYSKLSKEEQDKFFQEFKKIPQSIVNFLKSSGVWNDMSPKENNFLHTYPQDLKFQDQLNISWRMESAASLLWALGVLAEFPSFEKQTGTELLEKIPKDKESIQFIESAKLRSSDELEAKRSLSQSWHWRSRTRQLIEEGRHFPIVAQLPQFKGYDDVVRFSAKALRDEGIFSEIIDEDFPVRGKAYRNLTAEEWSEVRSITMERHFALNWVCGYAPDNRWDETPTET